MTVWLLLTGDVDYEILGVFSSPHLAMAHAETANPQYPGGSYEPRSWASALPDGWIDELGWRIRPVTIDSP